ncbi:MAG: methyltransferase [Actinomycetales bacterium]|nr:methyltransferase [Actinomycetales bacterium]
MSSEHYFSEEPGSDFTPREIRVWLAERELMVTTSNGIFSPEHVDTGTRVLLDWLAKAPTEGNLLDIGCGWGPIAISLALHAPEATIWAVDVNERSLELTRMNAAKLGLANVHVCRPEEVPADVRFSGIWSNPPIRVGKDVLHEILLTWLPRLEEGAEGYLVVAKQLGADSLQKWLSDTLGDAFDVARVETDRGFRVIRAVSI